MLQGGRKVLFRHCRSILKCLTDREENRKKQKKTVFRRRKSDAAESEGKE